MRPRTLVILIVLSLVPASSRGQQETATEAERAFAEGTQHYRQGDYAKALAAFLRSHSLHPHFLTLCNAARCEERLQDPVKAAELYRRCLKEGGENSPKAKQIADALRGVESALASITVETRASQASVFVDGKLEGAAPLRLLLKPGPHAVELRRGATRSKTIKVEARAGEKQTVTLELPQRALSKAPAVRAPVLEPPSQEPEDKPGRRRLHQAWFWTAAGLTVAFAVASAVLGVTALDAHRDYQADPTREGFDLVIQRRDLTNVFFGLTLGAASAGGVLFFFTRFRGPRDEQEPELGRELTFNLAGRF